ncbi:Gram-negative bacterial tonB protein [compost metagenome]
MLQIDHMNKTLSILALALVAIQHVKAQDNTSQPLIFTRQSAIDSIVSQKGNLLQLESSGKKPMLHINGQLKPYKYISNIAPKDIGKLTYYAHTKSGPYHRLLADGGPLIALQLAKITPQPEKNGLQGYEKSSHYIDDSTPKQQIIPQDNTIYLPTEPGLYVAAYMGGMEKFDKFIADNIKYPTEAEAKKIQGKVKLSFVVEKDGSLTNIKPETQLGYGLEDEARRLFILSRRWNPSIKDGKLKRVRLTYEVKFEKNFN